MRTAKNSFLSESVARRVQFGCLQAPNKPGAYEQAYSIVGCINTTTDKIVAKHRPINYRYKTMYKPSTDHALKHDVKCSLSSYHHFACI